MKKLIYTVALLVMGITASYAQKSERQKLTAEQRAEKVTAALAQKLSLSEDQKLKIKQIELDRIKQNDELRKSDANAMKAKMEERKALIKANQDKIDAVLTADQRKTLNASKDEMRSKMKDRKRVRMPRGDKATKAEKTSPASNN